MIRLTRQKGLIERFCAHLGRQGATSRFLDWVAGLLIGPLPQPAWGGGNSQAGSAWTHPLSGPSLMSGLPGGGSSTPAAPRTQFSSHKNVLKKECDDPKYHGMHGRPCKYVSTGSDKTCPMGTQLGWYWKYKTKVGVIYYVDCCGKLTNPTNLQKVPFCNWSNEPNWCGGAGGNQYVCTLAALNISEDKSKLRVTKVNV